MLRLGEEIRGNEGRICILFGDDQDLARTRQHIDPHLAENHPLGQGDVDVAGADDLIDPGDGFRPPGKGGNSLGAPYFEDPIHPREASRDKDCRMDFALPANGGGHDDLPHPCNLSRHGPHEDAGE